jgi:outer membrane protein assembly factor BamB
MIPPVLAALALLQAPPAPAAVPGILHAGAPTGATTDPGPETSPRLAWAAPVGVNAVTPPARVTIAGRDHVLVGSGSDVVAFDLRSGAATWTAPGADLVNATPVALGDAVVALDMAGHARTLDLATGAMRADVELDFPLQTSPVVAAGVLAFEEKAPSAVEPESLLHGWDASTRTPKWKASYPLARGGTPGTDGTRVFVVTRDTVRAHALADGSASWTQPLGPARRAYDPVVSGGSVVVLAQAVPSRLACFDAATGAVKWTAELPGLLSDVSPTVTDDEVIVPTSDPLGLTRFALADGAPRPFVPLPANAVAQVVAAPKRLYVPTRAAVLGLDRATGEVAWRSEVTGLILHVTVVGTRLLVALADGKLLCLDGGA